MSRPARFTQADLRRAIAGFLAAGLLIKSARIKPDGEIEILPVTGKPEHDNDEWADLA